MAIENLREIGNVLYEKRADGMLYPVRRIRPDMEAQGVKPQTPGILDVGGLREKLTMLNKTFNPVEAIGQSMRAGERMMSSDVPGWDRVAALGDMLSGVAGVTAPVAALARTGAPAATALMEGLLGWSPTREAVGDTARAVGRDVVDRLNQRGPMPTTYSNPIPGLLGGADDVSIESVLRSKYPDVKISVSGNPERGYTLNKIDVPKAKRESGIGTAVMNDLVSLADQQGAILKLSPSKDFGGSVPRLKDFYARFGFVPNKGKNADYSISESMYRTPSQPASPSLPTPRNDAEAMARDILQLRAEGRAADVTDEMMAAADPQYMFYNTPLPMDYASRMERARKSHRTDLYSGTGDDFQAFDDRAVYASTNPDLAYTYAPSDGGMILPLAMRAKHGTPMVDAGGANWNKLNPSMRVGGDNALPIPDDIVPHDAKRFDEWPMATRDYEEAAKRAGFSGVTFNNIVDVGGYFSKARPKVGTPEYDAHIDYLHSATKPTTVEARFYPNQVRSRFARFDPEFAHLRNLSAAVAAGLPLGLLAMQPDQEQY